MSDANKYSQKLHGRRVLVVGGSAGLGFAAAEASIENGAIVVISSSSRERIENAIARILKDYPSAKGRLSGHVCDLAGQSTLEQNVVQLFEATGQVDHIIHSAGDSLPQLSLSDVTVENAIQAAMVRYYAPLIIGKHASKYLSPGPKSSITFTTGAVSDRPIPNWIVMGGIMSGVGGLMRGLALDLAPIRVNIVDPGAVETELWSHMSKDDFEAFKTKTRNSVPTGRVAQPEDIAEAYLYTMRDPNLTGAIIQTSSGTLLKGPH